MAQTMLVEMQIQDGQRLIERLAREGLVLTAAAWIKEGDSGEWYLYLATSLVGEDGATKLAYRRINSVIREMQKEGFSLDPFQIKVIAPTDPIAKGIASQLDELSTGAPARIEWSRLGELAIEEAYVYPWQACNYETINRGK